MSEGVLVHPKQKRKAGKCYIKHSLILVELGPIHSESYGEWSHCNKGQERSLYCIEAYTN